MAVPVIMPRQGQSVETCILTRWLKNKGETVKTGDLLFSYETDKAAFEAEAPADGILLDIFFQEGDEVPVLTNVAVIGKNGDDVASFHKEATAPVIPIEKESTVAPGSEAKKMDVPVSGKVRISPRARNMAEKLGVDILTINGSGPNGRIITKDIEKEREGIPIPYIPQTTQMDNSAFTDNKLSHVRKIIARAMHESIRTSAQLTHHMSADARKILELRARIKTELNKGSKLNLSLNDMICFAVVKALQQFPDANAHFLDEKIRIFKKVHLGVAVDTPRGLMVPSITDASDLSLTGFSDRLSKAVEQCKKGNINPELLASTSASFTVSNLGNYGVEMFTPIINLPQVAILGVNTIIHRPADLGGGVFGFVPMIGLSLTYDHRAIDGGPASLFLKAIKDQIEHFEYNL